MKWLSLRQINGTKKLLAALTLSISATMLTAQEYWTNTNHQFLNSEKILYQPGTNFHTAIRNYEMRQTQALFDYDSLLYSNLRTMGGKQNLIKRFFNNDLLSWNKKDYKVAINPLFNLEAGKEQVDGQNTLVNTRGLMINGTIGKNTAFYGDFYENQGTFPNYIEEFANEYEIIPGQGYAKKQNYSQTTRVKDYSSASGYVSVNAGQHFNIQLGSGKNFIGDGYRSMLLSDVAYNYPFLKINTTFGKVKYMVMWTSMTHLVENNVYNDRYPVKYGAFHFLDWNLGKRLSVGFFEAVTWADVDRNGNKRGFEWQYANPFVFFRPVENNIGSPDNMTMGINTKFIAAKWLTLYGQFALDEFKLDEIRSGNKWWANKHGFQIGMKTFDLFGIHNLRMQAEYNQARPYLYSHSYPANNYGHFNQPLAHPMGANFREGLAVANYHYKRIYVRLQAVKATYGLDTNSVSYGKDIFQSNENRANDYGNAIGQGLITNLTFADASLSYLINPRTNFNLAVGMRYRSESNSQRTLDTKFVYVALRTSLRNLYYDF